MGSPDAIRRLHKTENGPTESISANFATVQDSGEVLGTDPYDEGKFVILVAHCDLSTPGCRKVDTHHNELIVFCPTAIALSVGL